ncbi:MAG: ATPase AAA, partial [Gammaproteobacteria bacterium]|nr:ATPase AAA [Gammaproteobacteria bacterium]
MRASYQPQVFRIIRIPFIVSFYAMSESDNFFSKANSLIDRLESLLPAPPRRAETNSCTALRWRHQNNQSWLEPILHTSAIELDDLKCIDRQKAAIVQNTRQFVNKVPANNVLLWGPRGTG